MDRFEHEFTPKPPLKRIADYYDSATCPCRSDMDEMMESLVVHKICCNPLCRNPTKATGYYADTYTRPCKLPGNENVKHYIQLIYCTVKCCREAIAGFE